MESTLHLVIEGGDIVKGVEIASELESMIMSEALMQYTCLDSMRSRIEDLWPTMKDKLIQNIRQQLEVFDPEVYANVFRTYSVLDAHLTAMQTQKMKKQALDESASNRSLLGKDGQQAPQSPRAPAAPAPVPAPAAKKPAKRDNYVDVLQKYLSRGNPYK